MRSFFIAVGWVIRGEWDWRLFPLGQRGPDHGGKPESQIQMQVPEANTQRVRVKPAGMRLNSSFIFITSFSLIWPPYMQASAGWQKGGGDCGQHPSEWDWQGRGRSLLRDDHRQNQRRGRSPSRARYAYYTPAQLYAYSHRNWICSNIYGQVGMLSHAPLTHGLSGIRMNFSCGASTGWPIPELTPLAWMEVCIGDIKHLWTTWIT